MQVEDRESNRRHAPRGRAFIALVCIVLTALPWQRVGAVPGNGFEATIPDTMAFAGERLAATAASLSPPAYPSETRPDGSWATTPPTGFGSGSFPGSLWFMYEYTHDSTWRTRAEFWQAPLEEQKFNTSDHDLGFILYNSYGNAYRLTGDARFRDILLTAAHSLSTRYVPSMGYVRSRGDVTDLSNFPVIIDTMINIELLFWGARNGGDPAWAEMAHQHALNTYESHVRDDGSIHQTVNFDPVTGKIKEQGKEQGCRLETTWARGQAWAVYGFTVAYRETKDPRMLYAARKTADYFLSHVPLDKVPYWDFQAPHIPDEPRDSSAAAATASALIELSQLETNSKRAATYWAAARDILRSLSSEAYLSRGTSVASILLHGTAYKPHDRFDQGLVYGDYYFLEALTRYVRARPPSGSPPREPYSPVVLRTPVPDAPYVPLGTDVKVVFGTDVVGVNERTFVLKEGSHKVDATVRYDAATRTAILDPRQDLRAGETYTVVLDDDIEDSRGHSIDTTRWSFSTVEETPRFREHFFDFESGVLTPASIGVDRIVGLVELSSPALKGSWSALIPDVSSAYLEEYFTDTRDVRVTFYVRVDALPTANAHLVSFRLEGEELAHLVLRPSGTLQLYNGASTVGPQSNPLRVGRVYRVSLTQANGRGDVSVLEAFLAEGDAPFDCPFASSRVRLSDDEVDRMRIGATTVPLNVTLDDIRLETARP